MKLPILGTIDERFLTHRLRSTSIGGLAAVLLAGSLFFYNISHHVIRWDLLAIVATAGGGEDGGDGLVPDEGLRRWQRTDWNSIFNRP